MPVTSLSSIRFLKKDQTREGFITRSFRSGVSLHSHTMFSEESLETVSRYLRRIPALSAAIRCHASSKQRDLFDFSRAFWTPPLSPPMACHVEEEQIARRLGLPALVSLTDHDDIRAASSLRLREQSARVPVSTEWTIPFGPTFFHLGVHNIPPDRAPEVQNELATYTRSSPSPDGLHSRLDWLNSFPQTLVVLNHPLWDEKGVGDVLHLKTLEQLVTKCGRFIHALELNGLRCWKENLEVVRLAKQADLPIISGGDRHGCEPNAILNLSRAEVFADFVEEIRYARLSHVVVMPQYREPLKLRIPETIADVLRHYPENPPGRRLWTERVFYRKPEDETVVPLSALWPDGGPRILPYVVGAMRLAGWRAMRPALRFALE
ncbi:MAG TPA: hypothetical protein VH477_14380 [Bryobacteraceae bacterium]